jgi:hypothetical protein
METGAKGVCAFTSPTDEDVQFLSVRQRNPPQINTLAFKGFADISDAAGRQRSSLSLSILPPGAIPPDAVFCAQK